jgi:hypothetical protein
MAFPVVETTATTTGFALSTSPAINLPSGIAANDLLIILFRTASGAGATPPSGWTELAESLDSGDGTTVNYRYADGTEGSTVNFSTANARFTAVAYRISGAEDPGTQAPEINTIVTGSDTAPNSGNLTPTGGAKDYLWLTLIGYASGPPPSDSTEPSNYINALKAGDSNFVVRVLAATRALNAASENPGAWTITSSAAWLAWTLAIHPVAASPVDLAPDPLTVPLNIPSVGVTSGSPPTWTKVGAGAVATSTSLSASVSIPSQTVAYDLMLIHCVGRNNSMDWSASGFTSLGSGTQVNSGIAEKWLYKYSDGSDAGTSVTVTNTVSTNGWSAHCTVYRGGVTGGDPLDVPEVNDQTHSGLLMTAPAITTVTSGSLLLRSFASSGAEGHFGHSEGTVDHNAIESIGVGHAHSLTYFISGAAGAKAASTATQSGSGDRWIGRTYALKPYPVGAGTTTLTPSPLEFNLDVTPGWITSNGVSLNPYPIPLTMDFPEPLVVSGTASVAIGPSPEVIFAEVMQPTVYPIFQPKPWTPIVSYSTEISASYASLWTGMQRALPVWRLSGSNDPLGWRFSYANNGTTTDAEPESTARYTNEFTGYSDHVLHHARLEPPVNNTLNLGTYDPVLSGSIYMYLRPETIVNSGSITAAQMFTMNPSGTAFGARLSSSGFIYNDIYNTNFAESDVSSQEIAGLKWWPLLFDWDRTAGITRLYISGVQVINNTNGIDNDPGVGDFMFGGSTSMVPRSIDASIGAMYVWDRILTTNERNFLTNDPWAPFRSNRVSVTPDPLPLPIVVETPSAAPTFAINAEYVPEELILVLCDKNWERLIATNKIHSFSLDEELGGAQNTGTVVISEDDPVADLIPNPEDDLSEPVRFEVYDSATLLFAGLVDKSQTRINMDGELEFGGVQRGAELGERNFGRRDLLGWTLEETFRELTRDNIGRAPFASAPTAPELWQLSVQSAVPAALLSGSHIDHPPINTITGEPQIGQYYLANPNVQSNDYFKIDLGESKRIDAIRVIFEWESRRWYNWQLHTSQAHDSALGGGTLRYTHSSLEPYGPDGVLIELTGVNDRWVSIFQDAAQDLDVSDTDAPMKIAGVSVYQNILEPGAETNYTIPWIDNHDAGNVVSTYPSGSPIIFPMIGAFPGDGWHSITAPAQTRFAPSHVLLVSGSVSHTFFGTSDAAYFTGPTGGWVDFYVDGVLRSSNVQIPADTFQFLGYEVTGLSPNTQHTLSATVRSGTPYLDYFQGEYQGAWRKIQEDDPNIRYANLSDFRTPSVVHNAGYYGGKGVRLNFDGGSDTLYYRFTGSMIRIVTSKGPDGGVCTVEVDGVRVLGPSGPVPTNPTSLGGPNVVDTYSVTRTFHDLLAEWEGSWGEHTLKIEHRGGSPQHPFAYESDTDIDQIEGYFAHIIYLRSAHDTNLSLLGKLAELTNTFLRLNYDGTADLLGEIGAYRGHIIREGENEGGNIENAEVEADWTNAVSAIVAIGKGVGDQILKVVVMDKPAMDRLGLKVAKLELHDVVDAYMLTRRAWQALQDSKRPRRNYRVTWRGD